MVTVMARDNTWWSMTQNGIYCHFLYSFFLSNHLSGSVWINQSRTASPPFQSKMRFYFAYISCSDTVFNPREVVNRSRYFRIDCLIYRPLVHQSGVLNRKDSVWKKLLNGFQGNLERFLLTQLYLVVDHCIVKI